MPIVKKIAEFASVPVIMKPNAGLPVCECGHTHYNVDPTEFSSVVACAVSMGISIVGGCCGTTPEYIKRVSEAIADLPFQKPKAKTHTLVSSYSHAVEIGKSPILIGERINPTGKKRFKQALKENDMDYILKEGITQQEKGVHILDVNVGMPDIDEEAVLVNTVCELQTVTDLPLQIDTSSAQAMERALRRYNGKAMINSVNGKRESMETVFPLAKKYGGVIVALTLDENGIPSTAEGRIKIAENIISTAKRYGISDKDIVFDTLCMAVSADTSAPSATLKSLKYIKEHMGINTVLGVSNISFGLPARDVVNSSFFAFSLENGLSAAIINPYSEDMMKVYYSYMLLHGMDDNCQNYIKFASELPVTNPASGSGSPSVTSATATQSDINGITSLQYSIIKGLKDRAAVECSKLLSATEPLVIIDEHIIPALDSVGKGFEEKRIYLPQLLMSADAAKSAFDVIKQYMNNNGGSAEKKLKIVLATVKGDIHDIGKNIVKVLLENYGYDVIDLGRDVPPEDIVEAIKKENAHICGLSALMTTTVPAMEETIKLIKKNTPTCKTVVGGAVLNREYADKICADKYAKDAMETVRFAEELYSEYKKD
jgi:5-methyltetrahydrofolate--homocysteine methyltransferase